jgi:cytochrome c biogenesis protein CcmG/thiol:disulfide interchange protein DsbE
MRILQVVTGVALALAIVFVVLAVSAAERTTTTSTFPADTPVTIARGRLAPAFNVPRLGGGKPVTLAAELGHPVVLNFFASWCVDCQAELRAFAEVSNGADTGVVFLAVDSNDTDTADAAHLLAAAGDRYPTGIDAEGGVATSYEVPGLPTTVFINRTGHVVGVALGAQSVADLYRWVATLEKP